MLKCVIIDDELPCIETLQLMLKIKFADVISVDGYTTEPTVAAELINKLRPEVVFLDVEMPQLTGLELLQTFKKIDFHVIFTTAHQHYALQAIKLSALDYLLKPISMEELSACIQKCIQNKAHNGNEIITSFLEQMKTANAVKKIAIASNNTVQFIPVNEIVRIESISNYSTVYFTSHKKLLVSKTLKEFENQLLAFNFLRVHHSHLINLQHVVGYKNQDGGYLIMQGNEAIEISRRKKQEVLLRLNSF